jgi:hypothetical protein
MHEPLEPCFWPTPSNDTFSIECGYGIGKAKGKKGEKRGKEGEKVWGGRGKKD